MTTYPVTKIDCFVIGGVRIEFSRANNVPGFTHRVIIWRFVGERMQTIAKDWFADGRPTVRAARFYLAKHAEAAR